MRTTPVRLRSKLKLFQAAMAGCCLLLFMPCARAQFTWPVYESFGEYTNDTRLGSTATNAAVPAWWNVGNTATASNPRVFDTNALSFPGLIADSNSVPKGTISSSVTGSHDAGAHFTSHPGTIYVSFLVSNIFNAGGLNADRMFFNLADSDSATGFRMSAYFTPDYRIKVSKNQSSGTGILTVGSPVLTTNATHLIVMRYSTNSVVGAPGKVDFWLDPTPFGDDTQIPAPTLTTTNGGNVNSFQCFSMTSRGTGLYTYNLDEIRLGDTWSSVTPLATVAPGPMFAVSGGGTGCPGDAFPVNLSGSVTTNDYLLFTNAIYAGTTITGTGSALNFGQQSAVGYYSVLASNNVTGSIGWMSNSVTIYVRAPVALVSSPIPVITATNNRAQFNVAVTGDELSYHWYRDGNLLSNDFHISGSTTNVLVVWPATAADAGAYTCIITNPCSVTPVTSDPATLTLDGVDNLLWVGNAFLNLWDVNNAALPYFTDTNGSAVIFHGGDNVKFDDTADPTVGVILTNTLTPTLFNIDCSRYYIFSGIGSIAGTGTLVKNGTGRVSISNSVVNTYSGGTIISNGTIHLRVSLNNLGTGPLTLAGGTLETEETQTFTNTIFMPVSSTLQINKSALSAMGISGALNGSTGTTLNVTNFNVAINVTNRLSFTGLFTNNAAIALSTYTNPVVLELAPNNTTGVEIFNGAISGSGRVTKVSGAGAAYLNGANSYNGQTEVDAGLLAGSGSIFGPMVVGTNGTLGAGSENGIGTFTVNSNVVLNGKALIRVDKAQAQSNDLVVATGFITNGGVGTITITNIGATSLVPGDLFKIFSGAVSNGNALTITGGGVTWSNNLAIDGSVIVIPTSSPIAGYSTNINYSVSGNTMTIVWPGTHLGWILQSQTNAGISPTNWFDVANTSTLTNFSSTVNPANPPTFFRLRHP